MTEAGTAAAVLERPITHAGWSTGSSLDAVAETLCGDLAAYLGRPLAVDSILAPAPSMIEVRLRTVTAGGSGWVLLTGRSRADDLAMGTARAVVDAVRDHDPLTVLVWSLDRNSTLLGAVARQDGVERPTVGDEATTDRLRRLLDTVTSDGRLGARTLTGDYRVLRRGASELALLLAPEAVTAADEALAALERSLTPLEES